MTIDCHYDADDVIRFIHWPALALAHQPADGAGNPMKMNGTGVG